MFQARRGFFFFLTVDLGLPRSGIMSITSVIFERVTSASSAMLRRGDGETWRHYGKNLEENLRDLADRLKRGGYRAKPVKRAFIAKHNGRQRPLGVTVLEDKIVQRTRLKCWTRSMRRIFSVFRMASVLGEAPMGR